MALHEFLELHRSEILQSCQKRLEWAPLVPAGGAVADEVEWLFDALTQAARGVSGRRPRLDARSSANAPVILAAMSAALGDATDRRGLRFTPENSALCRSFIEAQSLSELDLKPVRVVDILRRVKNAVVPDRAMSIALDVDEAICADADERLLTLAVRQLVDNAIQFSRFQAHLLLGCRAEADGIVIDVEDGCGGVQDTAPAGRPARSGGHLGLGLAVTTLAVSAMNGSLSVENHPGQGCTYALRFPPASPPSWSAGLLRLPPLAHEGHCADAIATRWTSRHK